MNTRPSWARLKVMAVNFPNKKGEPGRVIFRVLHIRVGSAQKDLTTNKEVPFFGARQSDSPTGVRSGNLAFLGEQRNLGTEGNDSQFAAEGGRRGRQENP